jgi:alkylation response protein AidB-like acyl-CoA dehydrogenase
MDFSLSDEQKMFREMFRDFAEREVVKVAEEIDQTEQPPKKLLKKAAEQGFLGATLPEDYGGVGLDWLSFSFLIEELAKACRSTALTIGLHLSRGAMAIANAGSDDQKERFLPGIAEGEALCAYAFTEPEAGSDLSSLQTLATRDGDHYRLNGVKTWVSNAGIAGLFVVFAATNPKAGQDGITAFIVEKDQPGVFVGYREPTLGLRGLGMHTVYFEDCRVPVANRLGAEGEGWAIGQQAENRTRLVIAAAALGAAEAVLVSGIRYSIERKQFGDSVARKQAIQNLIAETSIEIEALRNIIYHTAWLMDSRHDYHQESLMTKTFAGRVAKDATNRMVQVHGGAGYMEDYPIARAYRDVRALRILGGTDEVQKFLVARNLYEQEDLSLAF